MKFTELPEPHDPSAFYVIDVHGFVWKHATGARGKGAETFARWLGGVLRRAEGGRVVAADDAPPGTLTFRHELLEKSEFAGYKADRTKLSGDRLAEYLDVRRAAREVLDDIGIPVVVCPGFEADDVIATIAELASEQLASVVIVAADRDLLQLVAERDTGRVIVWDGTENYPRKVSGPPECLREMSVPPTKIADYFALVGGKNNIPGVKGIGPKAAVEILKAFPDLQAALEYVEPRNGGHGLLLNDKLREKLKTGADAARLSLSLATLRRDLPLDFPDILRRSLYQPT